VSPTKGEVPVEDQDKIQSEDDVEAHKRKIKATDEGSDEGSEDFELHKKKDMKATTEAAESSEDDFELHKRRN
jgi:hypothetical protein